MQTASKRGSIGERLVARYLRNKGYDIVGANYFCRFGEIDVIATNKKYIVFIEVKTRGERAIARPCESVGFTKQEKLRQTALMYLSNNNTKLQPRFDVAEVILDDNNNMISLNYIKNAFE